MFQTHSLDLHEIRSRIASSLDLKDLATCARLSQDWNDSFTPPLYRSVVLSKHGLSMESVERNKHLIQSLRIKSSAYGKRSLTSTRDKVIFSVLTYSTLTTLDLRDNSIGDNGAQVLSEALKTNLTLATLDLEETSIESNGAQALSEALKVNSTLTTLDLRRNSIRDTGAQALSEALKVNSTLTTLDLGRTMIGSAGAKALADALMMNSTLTTLSLGGNSIRSSGTQALSEALRTNSTVTIIGAMF
ncbi:hypothetical protein EC957_003322 [Mortierella hygrophila]|uniref:RNI-like protein n=1 Tax=Mortierella hygrophila TaxID=979708 RepID=A0A9P6F3A6_9FUNG|nr:hypothetical protein EC957_003322 [Mortierella hygrophila]